MADIKSLIDKFNIFRTKDSILNDVAKDNGQITIDIKQPFSDDIDSNNSLKTKLETNIKDKLFNTEINNVGSNIFDEKIKPFDKGYNVSNTPDTDTKTPIDTTPIKPDTPTIEKNTADATNIQQEKIQQPEITTQEPEPEATQQYKIITVLQKPKLTTDSLGNYMPIDFDKRKGKSYSGAGEQQIDMIFNRLDTPEKFDMFMWSVSKAYDQLKSANLNDNENIIFLPYSYDNENGNMNGISLTFGGRQKEWAEKQLKILAKGINDKQNEEWLSNLELPQPKTTMDKITSKTWLQLFSFMQPPTNEMDPKSASIIESGQKENRLNAIKWDLIENIKECKDILDKYYKDKSQVGIALSVKNITETINNILLPQIDLLKNAEIASIISKYKEKPKSLTPIENEIVNYSKMLVRALSVIDSKTSTGYETTKAIETSLPFMADFFRGNLIGNATRGTTRTAMKIGGKGLAREFAKDAPKTFGARALQFGSDVVKSAGHTPLSPLTYTNMLENYSQTMETNGQYTKNDLRRGVIEAFTENFSERMFGALKGILPKSNNAFVNSLFGNNPVIKTMQKHMNVGGLLEETGEEYAGAFVNTMFGFALGDEKLASSFKEQLNNSVPTILSIGITVGLPQAIGMGIDFREIKKMNTRFNVAEDNLKQYFNKENSYIDINRYSDALKSLYINLNNAKYEEDKAEIKGKIAELNKTAANLAMEKGDSNGFILISEYSIAAQNSFYVTNKAMSELKNMSEEDRTKLSDNAINKLKNDFTNNLNWSLISRAAANNITDQNGKQHPTCFLYTDNGVTYVLNGQKDNMFYFVDVNGNTISKSADELRNNENLSVLHLNNLLSSFSNKELEDINSKFIDIAQYNAGYRYKVNDNGEIRYYTDNKDLIKSNIPYEQINRDKIESHLVGLYDLVRIDNITNAVEDMANAFAEPAAEQTSTEQTSTEQTSTEQTSTEQQKPTQEPAQEQPSEEPIQEQPQEQTTQEQQIQEQTTEEQETTEQEPIQPTQQEQTAQQEIEPAQEQPAQEEDDSTALNEQENTESQSNEPTTNELDKKSDISVKEQVQASEAEVSAFDRVKNIIIATAQRKERDINGFAHLLRSLSDEELNEALEFVNTKKGRSKIDKINIGELRSHIYYELEERDLSKNLEEAENRGYEYSLKSFENLPADFDYAGYIINHELLAENYEKSGYKGMAAFQRGLIRAVKKLQVQAAEAESRIAQNEQENTESQGKKPNIPKTEEAALRDALIDKLREAGIDVITDVEEAQRLLDEANGKGVSFFRTADGNAYGFTVGGKIYIDQRIATADTPIHEYAHLWASAMQKLNPNEWENIVKLMKGTPIWEEVKRNYPELTTDNEIADEVLAFYSGNRGAERLREEHAKILKGNGNVVEKVKAINAIKRVKEALKRFWKNVAEWFGIHFTTAEEVADKVLSDLLNGVNPTLAGVENDIRFEENSEEADIVARAKADGTYMKAPNGKKSNLSPRQWVQVRTKAFKDWFGDWENDPDNSSKVVDENGEPMVVYHGTQSEFSSFDKDAILERKDGIKGFYFVTEKRRGSVAGYYAQENGNVIPVFLNIRQPLVKSTIEKYDAKDIPSGSDGIISTAGNDIERRYYDYTDEQVKTERVKKGDIVEIVAFEPTQIKSATDNVGTFNRNNPDIRYQFVGEKGAAAMDKAEEATIRLDNLAVARDMEKAGKDAKDIKLATGWERGAEGKWRYEILDLKYFGKGDAGYKKARGKQSWSKELDSLSDRIFNGEELSEEEQKRFEELAKEEENFKTDYLNREKPYLSDWVENDELFKAYPDLKRVQIVFTDQMPENIGGIYKDSENTIIVNTNYVDNISSVLAHEVQHAIQYIEGFAKGGSEESVQDLFDRVHSEYMARVWADELKEKAKEIGEYYNQTAVYDALVNDYKGFEDYMPNKEERIKGFNYFVRGYADRSLDNLIEKFRADERVSINSHNEYMKLAGEVEARNVQSRLGMSADERRRSLAIETEDVERKDQIFLEDGLGVSASEVDKETNAANRRASNKSVISSRFERQAEIQREEKNTKSAANIVLGNANVVLNDTNIFDEQYQNAIDNNLIDENVSPLIDSFGITWGYQLKNGVIVINKDVFVSDILDKRVKDNLSLLISSLMKTNKTFFKEGISFFKKLPIWVLYKNDTKSNEDTIKEIINDILLGNTSIDTNKLELLKQYTVQDMNDILDNATKWFEKFEGISSNMFAGNSISDILDTTLGDLMPKEITTTQEGKRLNWFSKLGIDIRSKLFDSLDWFRVVSDKTKDKTASELYDAMIVHTKRVQGKIDIFDKEYVRPIIDTIQSMLGKDFGNSTLSLDLIQEYFAIKSLLGRTASLYKEKFELYLTNHESKKPPMFDEFKQIYDEITEDEIRQRINEMGEKSSMSILQKVDIYYLMEDVRRTLAAEMFVKQYVYSSANTLNQGLQGEQSLGLINEVTNEPYSELYQLLYSDEQSSQTMHSPIEIIEQADILIDRAGLRNEFDFIGNQIQAILNYVNIERVENGLMSYDTFAKRQLMKDFVNQRGENSSEGNLYEITAKQKANEKMKGKDWFNPNSITSIIAVAQTEIATMEKELLAQRLSYFLTNPNNFDVLSQYGMIIDEKETLNEELSEDERNSIMDKNIVLLYGERHTDKNTKGQVDKKKINILKRNDDGTFTKVTISFDNKFIGLEEFVKFVNNNFKYEELRGISKAVAPFTAWTSRIYTILSPLFPTKNLFKDLMVTPWLPAKELNGKNSQYAIKNFYNVFNNLSFILKMSFTEKSFSKKGFENKLKARSQELFEYYLEYSKQHSIFSIEDQIGALSKENKTLQDIERALSGKENKFIKFTERALLIKFMQHYAELFENLHKFSAYVTLRKLGYGEERSAQIANNATLNYDRSGSIGRQLNAIIPFAKAALGGLYRTNYLLPKYNPKGFLQRVITLAVLGVMQGLMYDPDDDDISEFARKSGMVFGSFLYPLLPEELSIVRPVRALVIVMAGKKSPAYFKQELMESTIDLVPVASDALRGAFSYNPLTNKTEFDVGQLFANTDKMTAFYALAMLASYINENKNSFGKNVLLNEETNTDKTRYGRTKQDYGLYDYLARLYNSILNGVDIDDRAAMSNKIGKNGERLMTIAKEDVEFVINNYIPFGRLYAYTAEIIYDAVNDKRINKGHIPLIGGLFAQKYFGKDYYLVNNIKYELKDFTNDFSQSQIEEIKTNILVKADNRFGIRYKALKDNNANPRMLDKAKQKMNDAFNVFILDINNFVNDNGDKKIDFTEDEYKFMLKSFLDSSIMKKALSIGEDTLNKHTAKRVERTYKRYKKHNNENIDTDKENMKDAAKNFKKMLYDKSITEEEFNDKLNSLYEPLFQQIKLRAKFAGYSIE